MSDIVHLFLWVSHGENISSKNIYYPIESPFQSVNMYSNAFQMSTLNELKNIVNDPCKLVLGTCPFIPFFDKKTGKNDILVPPLLFGFASPDEPDIIQWSGLHYFKIKTIPDLGKKSEISKQIADAARINREQNYPTIKQKTIEEQAYEQILQYKTTCEIQEHVLIKSYSDLLGSGNSIRLYTYSEIFKLVIDICNDKKNNVDPKNVSLGIFSCQSRDPNYIKNYIQDTISNLLPSLAESAPQANIFSSDDINTDASVEDTGKMNATEYYASLTMIQLNTNPSVNWKSLTDIRHQGCGLNVLSFFGILEKNVARETLLCLSLKGTSIFKIVDYIDYHTKNLGIKNDGYIIARCDFQTGLSNIIELMSNYSTADKYCIVFKMYDNDTYFKDTSTKKSHVGHTVAFYKYDNKYYYVDPQGEIIREFSISAINIPELENDIKQLYINPNQPNNIPKWKFIDLIYTVKIDNKFDNKRPAIKLASQASNLGCEMLERTEDIRYGGKKLTKKTRKIKSKAKSRTKSKAKSRTKSRTRTKAKYSSKAKSRTKAKIHHGGNITDGKNLDEFEYLMLLIDQKNNIPTVLDTVTIKDI